MSDEWQDPFAAGDEAARERARRRAEREARRRERRRQLADKVREEAGARDDLGALSGPATPEPGAPGRPGPSEEPAAGPPDAVREPATGAPDPAEPAIGGVEAGGEPAVEGPEAIDEREAGEEPEAVDLSELPARPAIRRPGRRLAARGQTPRGVILRRRLLAFGLLVAAFALFAFGAATVADRIGGTGAVEGPEVAEEPETISVTIPEGFDRRQIAAVAREAGLRGNYVRASRSARGFNAARFGAADADSLEGFLFPATYELRANAHVSALIQRQLQAFRERIQEVDTRRAEQANLDIYDVLKIASMIEREVQIPRERRLVAAVIYNRLAAGSPLGIDATIRYEDQNFDEPLTESRLAEPTPYNTRVHAGLPPTPIGNPGIEAIGAAANPADVDHFYYVVKPYTCGEHVFTSSEEEFHQAVAEYQRALEEEGGAPTPEDC